MIVCSRAVPLAEKKGAEEQSRVDRGSVGTLV